MHASHFLSRLPRALFAALLACLIAGAPAFAQLKTGDPAPAFELPAFDGKVHNLADFKGKIVVLEWFNHGCPFVKKHYGAKNMQALQKEFTQKGVVWLSICSSAEGKQGFDTVEGHASAAKAHGTASTAILLDPDGKVGRAYGAKTTPHLFVIGKEGAVLYQGAIDDDPSADPATLPKAKNYVRAALEATLAGEPVGTGAVPPYGCSVKYKE